jgi:D-serine deaminase-like pyridoxal phosphate-dependent protein
MSAPVLTYAERLHQHLIGRQGSRGDLNTPALIVELDALDRNIARMAERAAAAGVALRPHAKTHKCAAIARRQIEAGASGVCCAKLGEAEALIEAGVSGVLITSPIVGAPAIERLAALCRKAPDLMVAVDHPQTVEMLAATGVSATLLVDVDPGLHRTGVADAAAAVALARAIDRSGALTFGGVQYYCGAQQHIEAFDERRAAIVERMEYLQKVLAELAAAGVPARIVSGGGTGTHAIDLEIGVFTELQVGSYVFMDRQYNDCDLTGAGRPEFETSLMIDARVISANHPRMATLDAGFKAFATEAGAPPVLAGAPEGSSFRFMGDEHGCILPPRGVEPPRLGAVVTLGAPHCDPTVNLHDAYHVVRGDTLVDIWPIEARGRSA